MQDSIIAYYLLGLKKHALINNHNAASSLMEEISKLSTVEGLIALFSAYLNSEEARYETLSLHSY